MTRASLEYCYYWNPHGLGHSFRPIFCCITVYCNVHWQVKYSKLGNLIHLLISNPICWLFTLFFRSFLFPAALFGLTVVSRVSHAASALAFGLLCFPAFLSASWTRAAFAGKLYSPLPQHKANCNFSGLQHTKPLCFAFFPVQYSSKASA